MREKISLTKNTIIISVTYLVLVLLAGFLLSTTILYLDNSLTLERKAYLTPYLLCFGDSSLHIQGSGFLLIGYLASITGLLLSVIFILMFLFRRKHRRNSFIYLSFSLVGLITFLVTVILSRYLFLEANANYGINRWILVNAPSFYILIVVISILILFNIYLFIYLGKKISQTSY